MNQAISVGPQESFLVAICVLFLGQFVNAKLPILKKFNIPRQSVILAAFAYYVTFRVMGSNYDAAVIASGHCGFGLGATPTAVMNMGSIVNRFGSSLQAFMMVPIVGAFFIDIVNLVILQGCISFIK